MKRTSRPIITAALNIATQVINSASGVFQELSLPEGSSELRFRLSPYGEFPANDIDGRPITQVIDREAAQTMAANFNSLRGKFATFFRGIPIYEGHADDPGWAEKNPGHKASAVGRIKSIEAGDDGIYVTSAINSDGVSLLGGEAPKYTGQSPYWRLAEIKGRAGHFRPVLLWSTALTNTPNILFNTIALNSLAGVEVDVEVKPSPDAGGPGEPENQNQNTDDMKLTADALKALGLAPDAEPTAEEISAAILKLASDQASAAAQAATAEGATTAANSRITLLETELTGLRGIRESAVITAVTDAINTGRITEADRQKWTDALNTDFPGESAKLGKLMPTINVTSKLGSLDRRGPAMTDAANAISNITEGVRAYAAEKSIDITTPAGWDRAYAECKTAKPELFGK